MAGSFPFSRPAENRANQPISFPIDESRSAIKQATPLPYSNCSSFCLFKLAVEPENPSSLPSLGSHLPTPHRRNWLAVGCLRVVWKLPAPFVYLLNPRLTHRVMPNLQGLSRPPFSLTRRRRSIPASFVYAVRLSVVPSFVWYRSRAKPWPLGPYSLAPASSVAADDGAPPRGHLLRRVHRPLLPLLNRDRSDPIQRSRSLDTPSGVILLKGPWNF
jgi:hypothetical protein